MILFLINFNIKNILKMCQFRLITFNNKKLLNKIPFETWVASFFNIKYESFKDKNT